jgi:hypothetical protein
MELAIADLRPAASIALPGKRRQMIAAPKEKQILRFAKDDKWEEG